MCVHMARRMNSRAYNRPGVLNPGPGLGLCLRPSLGHVIDIPMSDIKASYRVNDLQDCDSGFYMIVDLAKSPW